MKPESDSITKNHDHYFANYSQEPLADHSCKDVKNFLMVPKVRGMSSNSNNRYYQLGRIFKIF